MNPPDPTIKLRVTEAQSKDVGRALVRIDPEDLQRLGAEVGDTVEVQGKRRAVARALPLPSELRGQDRAQLDGVLRRNAEAALDDGVVLRRIHARPAEHVAIAPLLSQPTARDLEYIGRLLDGVPAQEGDLLRVSLFGARFTEFRVTETTPKGPVLIMPQTRLVVTGPLPAPTREGTRIGGAGAYEDIGALRHQMARLREMVEMPLRYPEIFQRLGVDPPRGVLLHGPSGCGKTLLARALAREVDAAFFVLSGPEVVHKFYGDSEAHVRKTFEEAIRRAPSILFIDEIDAIAPARAQGEVERRVVAQLLSLIDGLSERRGVVVLAATNLPWALDPALRRPGRLDREVAIPVPDRGGRLEILEIHSRGMPLAADVDLGLLAEQTPGFVGADLAAVCREAAMRCLRRLLPDLDLTQQRLGDQQLALLEVHRADFQHALTEIEPSALREVVVEVPSVRWTDVGGLSGVKEALIEAVVWPQRHAEALLEARVKPTRGILLAGPPGCGKTLLAKAVATEGGVNFISVKGPALLTKFVGESERALHDLFRTARRAAPCVLFFDEVDALLPVRGSGAAADGGVADRIIGQFLVELDGVEELPGVLVLAATNRADRIDPALLRPGRFDRVIHLGLPDAAARREILGVHLRDRPRAADVDMAALALAAEGLSGAELWGTCQGAALQSVRRAVQAGVPVELRMEDLLHAMHEMRSRPLA